MIIKKILKQMTRKFNRKPITIKTNNNKKKLQFIGRESIMCFSDAKIAKPRKNNNKK